MLMVAKFLKKAVGDQKWKMVLNCGCKNIGWVNGVEKEEDRGGGLTAGSLVETNLDLKTAFVRSTMKM